MRSLHLDVDSDIHAPRLVRHTLRTWLHSVECSDDTKLDVTILLNELATDAVHHVASRITTRLTFDDGRLRIDVHDDRTIDTTSAPRFPLDHLAEQTTDSWGRQTTSDDTHTWAEILC